jgi:hypothetical protein
VFGNCEEVELRLDGRSLGRRGPDRDRMSARLAHPPFTFPTGGFRPGTLEAVGYIGGRRVARHVVRTPGPIERLALAFDFSGRPRDRERKDQIFCYASLVDAWGTVVPGAWENVAFGVTGGGLLMGANPFSSEAGVATILLETEPGAAPASVYALAMVPNGGRVKLLGASAALEGRAARHEVRRTAHGGELVVEGRVVAALAADAPKFRVPASAPPESRELWRR